MNRTIGILLVGILLILSATFIVNLRLVQQTITENQGLLVEAVARQSTTYLHNAEQLMRSLSSIIPSLSREQQKVLLSFTRKDHPQFDSFFILDSDGLVQLEATHAQSLLGFDLSGEKYFPVVKQLHTLFFSDPFVSPTTGEVVITMVLPIMDGDMFAGMLVGELNLAQLQDFVHQINLGRDGIAFITDRQGVLVVHPTAVWVQERRNLANLPPVQAGLAGDKKTNLFYDDLFNRWMVGSVTTTETDWVVVGAQPLSTFAYPITLMTVLVFGAFAVSMLLVYMTLRNTRQQIALPIMSLAGQANTLAQEHAPDRGISTDELGGLTEIVSLGNNFSRMVDRLQSTIQRLETEVAERKQAEERLRQSELRLQVLAENARDIIFRYVYDPEPRFEYISPAIRAVTGYTPAEAYDNPHLFVTIAHPDEREIPAAVFLERRQAETYIMRGYTKTHRVIWLETQNVFMTDDDGAPTVVEGVIRDITARVQLEDQLRQSQKMEAIGQLAGGVAHDFNNILTAIMGYGSLALHRLPPDSPVKRDLEQIQLAAERAANLTRQLLAFARKDIVQLRVINLDDLILNLDKMLRRLIGADIELIMLPGPEPGLVKIDPGQMEQILVNLAVNARDAMPNGGILTIETANVMLDEAYQRHHAEVQVGCYVVFSVTDNGGGMSLEVQSRVFEPFFTTKEVGKGTGLGLSTCFGIVKRNGGYINVYSETGIGTTFKVYLPRVTDSGDVISPGAREARWSQASGGQETILLVEDEDAVRSLAGEALREYGYTVLEAANGAAAMTMLQETDFPALDLLITDVVMPRMRGTVLAEQLTARYLHLPVLYISGYTANTIELQNNISALDGAFLQKPFLPHTLLQKTRHLLDGGTE